MDALRVSWDENNLKLFIGNIIRKKYQSDIKYHMTLIFYLVYYQGQGDLVKTSTLSVCDKFISNGSFYSNLEPLMLISISKNTNLNNKFTCYNIMDCVFNIG